MLQYKKRRVSSTRKSNDYAYEQHRSLAMFGEQPTSTSSFPFFLPFPIVLVQLSRYIVATMTSDQHPKFALRSGRQSRGQTLTDVPEPHVLLVTDIVIDSYSRIGRHVSFGQHLVTLRVGADKAQP
jgi:hypothetical protein